MSRCVPPTDGRRTAVARALAWACVVAFVSLAAARAPRADALASANVLDLDDAAAYLRINAAELEALADTQQVPGRKLIGGWRFSRSALDAWLAGGEPVAAASRATGAPSSLSESGLAGVVGRGPDERRETEGRPAKEAQAVHAVQAASEGDVPGKDESRRDAAHAPTVGFPPAGKTAAEIFLRRHAVLLQKGERIVEPHVSYSLAQQRELVALSLGDNDDVVFYQATTVTDRIVTGQLAFRFGIANETELAVGARAKFFDSQANVDLDEGGGTIIPSSDDPRLGNSYAVEFIAGLSRTLLGESKHRPDVVLTIEGSAPVVHTSPAIGGKLWLLKSFDPVVVYGGVDYRYSSSEEHTNWNLLIARHLIRGTVGYAFSVNDSITLSTSFSGMFTPEAEFDDVILGQKESYSLRFGLTSRLRRGLYFEPHVTLGLSGVGNWVAFGITMPWFTSDLSRTAGDPS